MIKLNISISVIYGVYYPTSLLEFEITKLWTSCLGILLLFIIYYIYFTLFYSGIFSSITSFLYLKDVLGRSFEELKVMRLDFYLLWISWVNFNKIKVSQWSSESSTRIIEFIIEGSSSYFFNLLSKFTQFFILFTFYIAFYSSGPSKFW